jgi:adenylyl- and sulfurtransferase ThiI
MTQRKSTRKTPAKKLRKLEVVIKIQSLHPSLSAPEAVETIAASVSELANRFHAKYPGVRVNVERQKTFPVDPVTILVTIGIFIGTRIAEKSVDAVIDMAVKWAKGKLKGARVTKSKLPAASTKREKSSGK